MQVAGIAKLHQLFLCRPLPGSNPTFRSLITLPAVSRTVWSNLWRSKQSRLETYRTSTSNAASMKFIDIAANLLDDMYQGKYNDKEYHAPDLPAVLERAWAAGLEKIIITAGSLAEAKKALELAQTDDRLFCTVGCHPTRCGEFEAHEGGPSAYLAELGQVIAEGTLSGKVVAVGECGLDYDRLHFCDAATQRKYFALQFELAKSSQLPMFLHLRAATSDFMDIIKEHESDFVSGVVHSFDGSAEEMQQVLQCTKLSIGLNGCSLKTEENLAVAAQVPVERLLLETDCPWCDIRATHAGKSHVISTWPSRDKKKQAADAMVKGRNEPCTIRQVLEVVGGCRGADLEELAAHAYSNTVSIFFKTP